MCLTLKLFYIRRKQLLLMSCPRVPVHLAGGLFIKSKWHEAQAVSAPIAAKTEAICRRIAAVVLGTFAHPARSNRRRSLRAARPMTDNPHHHA